MLQIYFSEKIKSTLFIIIIIGTHYKFLQKRRSERRITFVLIPSAAFSLATCFDGCVDWWHWHSNSCSWLFPSSRRDEFEHGNSPLKPEKREKQTRKKSKIVVTQNNYTAMRLCIPWSFLSVNVLATFIGSKCSAKFTIYCSLVVPSPCYYSNYD